MAQERPIPLPGTSVSFGDQTDDRRSPCSLNRINDVFWKIVFPF